MRPSTMKRTLATTGIIALSAVSIAFLINFPPDQFDFYPKCVLFQWTGILCPGCGGTRAAHELVHLRFFAALRMNAMVVLLLPFLIAVLVWQNLIVGRCSPNAGLLAKPKVLWATLFLVVGFTIIRNIPVPPFSYLAPHSSAQAGSQTMQ